MRPHPRPLLAGLLAGLLAATSAASAGEIWDYSDETDAMGVRTRLALTATVDQSGASLFASLALRERDGVATIQLLLDDAAPLCQVHGQPPIQIRFDDGKVMPTTCVAEASGATDAVFLGPVVPIWLAITGSETMSVAVTVAGRGRPVFTFPVAALRIERLLDADELAAVREIRDAMVHKKETKHVWDFRPWHGFRAELGTPMAPGGTANSQANSPARSAKPDLRS